MQKQPLLVRVAMKSVDAGELVSSCQAIKDALDTFHVSCSCFSNNGFIDLSPGWAHSISGKEHTWYPEGSDVPGPAQSRMPDQAEPVWARLSWAMGDGSARALAWL